LDVDQTPLRLRLPGVTSEAHLEDSFEQVLDLVQTPLSSPIFFIKLNAT
jgi:hypothetical protein